MFYIIENVYYLLILEQSLPWMASERKCKENLDINLIGLFGTESQFNAEESNNENHDWEF